MLSIPPMVHGNFEHASSGQVASLSTAVVHLYLESMEVGHAPVAAIQSSIQPYFSEGGYQFSQLPFDIASPDSLATYVTAASKLSSSLAPFSRILLILTTHTDEDRGDLFVGKSDGKLVASKVSEVSDSFEAMNSN